MKANMLQVVLFDCYAECRGAITCTLNLAVTRLNNVTNTNCKISWLVLSKLLMNFQSSSFRY